VAAKERISDWTVGVPQLEIESCLGCGWRWYFPRLGCPRCGRRQIVRVRSGGAGRVVAVTTIHRAPPGPNMPNVPFAACLVDLDEGVRVMGRCDLGLQPGDDVIVNFEAGVPHFCGTPLR
jgi:uncharacterized OB-fold protein